jgi:hypothetical protein
MNSLLLSMGTDVETFVTKDGEIHALKPGEIPGSKASPYIIDDRFDVGIQPDNVLAEITFSPAEHGDMFEGLCVMAKDIAEKYLNNLGFVPEYKSSHIFEPEQLNFDAAMVAGCEPDFPAIAGEEDPVFNMALFERLRTASGHLHFGMKYPLSKSQVIQYVRGLDRAIGAQMVLEHNDPIRRKLYGQAGRFRYKDYGFEYRTPDNFWFNHCDKYARALWATAEEMFSIPLTDTIWSKVNDQHVELARAINLGLIPEIKDMLDSFDFPRVVV